MVAAALGWLGTVGTFVAYVLLVRGRITAGSAQYAAMNVGGGVLAGSASAVYHAWPSVASNLVWAVVGAHTLLLALRRRAALLRARRRAARAAAIGTHHRVLLRSTRRARIRSASGPACPQPRRGVTGPAVVRRRAERHAESAEHAVEA